MLKYLSRMRLKKMQNGGRPGGDPVQDSTFVKILRTPQVTREIVLDKVDRNQGEVAVSDYTPEEREAYMKYFEENFPFVDFTIQEFVLNNRREAAPAPIPASERGPDPDIEIQPTTTAPPIARLRPLESRGLPETELDKNLRPMRPVKTDVLVHEQPIMHDPAETARKAGFRGVQSNPVQIGVKRFFRRPDGTGYVKTEMFESGGKVGKKIKVLKKEGRPHDQAVAIALSMRDRGEL